VAGKSACSTLVFVLLLPLLLSAAPHPLTPLSAEEIRSAAQLLRSSRDFPSSGRFAQLVLAEPPKDQVMRNATGPRRAAAVVYDPAGNRTFEATVNLTANSVEQWKE